MSNSATDREKLSDLYFLMDSDSDSENLHFWNTFYDEDSYQSINDQFNQYVRQRIDRDFFIWIFDIDIHDIRNIELINADGNEELLYFCTETDHYTIMMWTS